MSAPRSALHLLAPSPPDQLRYRFPTRLLPAGIPVFRCHGAGFGPWWFGSTGHGRFDLATARDLPHRRI